MSKKKKDRPWEPEFIRADQPLELSDKATGRQSHTFLARKSKDKGGDWPYVLKKLARQNDPKRRARFHVEASILESLDHDGIARLIESNAHKFRTDEELFLITERICGLDLEEWSAPDIATAAKVIAHVVRTLEYCHSNGVWHRDIKPCHVILRDSSPDDPVLIDFGLGFNQQQIPEGGRISSVDEPIGNEFLWTPEKQVGGGDYRTDLTHCVGLLFFLVAKERPIAVKRKSGKKPHDDIDLGSHLGALSAAAKETIRLIFDKGFCFTIEDRWQNHADLLRPLRQLSGEIPMDSDFDIRLAKIRRAVNESPEVAIAKRMQELRTLSQAVVSDLLNRSGEVLQVARASGLGIVRVNVSHVNVNIPGKDFVIGSHVTRGSQVANTAITLQASTAGVLTWKAEETTRGVAGTRVADEVSFPLFDVATDHKLRTKIEDLFKAILEKCTSQE